jgi:PAS domain S-box-containing protein
MSDETKSHSLKPVYIGLLVFCLLMALTQSLSYQRFLLLKKKEQQRIESVANIAGTRLQEYLYQCLSVTHTLGFIIENNGIPADFEALGKDLLKSNRGIHAIEIVEQGTITHVYPMKGNEVVIGYNILADSNRNKEALKAIEKRSLFFAGPLKLKQGGVGVVGRLPLFIHHKFAGFAAVIIKLDTLLSTAGIVPSFDSDLVFQLSKINPNTQEEEFFITPDGENSIFKNGCIVTVNVPMGEWKLYVKMVKPVSFISVFSVILLGLVLSITGGMFAWYIAKQPYDLKRLVQEKTALLNTNETLLNETEQTARVGGWEADLKNNTFRWTKVAMEIHEVDPGYTPRLESMINFCKEGESRDRIIKVVQNAIENGRFFDEELQIVTAKGNERWVKVTGKCEPIDNGTHFRIYGATQDIHTRKLAEEEREDILESITDSFIAVDNSWNITYWNNAAERMFGIPQTSTPGQNYWELMGNVTGPLMYKEFHMAMQDQHMHFFECYFDSLQIWAEVSVYPKHNGLSIYVKDVTQHHSYVQAIEDQNKKLRDIAWMQSHVIRAPLARLMGLVYLLDKVDEQDMKQEELIRLITATANEVDSIIKNISALTDEIAVDKQEG